MAHFAKIGTDNIVEEVVTVNNVVIIDENGVEQEQLGIDFLTTLTGHTNWKQTSYNTIQGGHVNGGTPLRKNYAMIGMIYDASKDAFYETQPFTSWTLNETTCTWEPPIPFIDDGGDYHWDEAAYQADNTQGWVTN